MKPTGPEVKPAGVPVVKKTKLILPKGMSMDHPAIKAALEQLIAANPNANVVRLVKYNKPSPVKPSTSGGESSGVSRSPKKSPEKPSTSNDAGASSSDKTPEKLQISEEPATSQPSTSQETSISPAEPMVHSDDEEELDNVEQLSRGGSPSPSDTPIETPPISETPEVPRETESRFNPGSEENLKAVTNAVAKKVLEDLKVTNRRLHSLNAQLDMKLTSIQEKYKDFAEKVSLYLGDDTVAVPKGKVEKLITSCHRYFSPVVANFFASQFKNCMRTDHARRWTDNDFLFAFIIYSQGPQGYVYLSKLLALPPIESLNRWLDKAEVKPNIGIELNQFNNTVLGCLLMTEGDIQCNKATGETIGMDVPEPFRQPQPQLPREEEIVITIEDIVDEVDLDDDPHGNVPMETVQVQAQAHEPEPEPEPESEHDHGDGQGQKQGPEDGHEGGQGEGSAATQGTEEKVIDIIVEDDGDGDYLMVEDLNAFDALVAGNVASP